MKIKSFFALAFAFGVSFFTVSGQDSARYQLRISVPLIDLPQNRDLPYNYVSMNQALEYSNGMYELAFLGVDKLGNAIVRSKPGFNRKEF